MDNQEHAVSKLLEAFLIYLLKIEGQDMVKPQFL